MGNSKILGLTDIKTPKIDIKVICECMLKKKTTGG